MSARAAPHDVERSPAVFLHTGWRSGGTWLWSRLREGGQTHCLYEPLHEQAAQFRQRDIASLRPKSWNSNHSETAPYFAEYGALIQKTGRGVQLYQPRFAFDGFFLGPDEADPELQAYIENLLDSSPRLEDAAWESRAPVLKFCRSLGRVGWFERHFPHALHAVVLRDPVTQWASTRRLLEQQRNRYFTVAPLLVLARNARHPLVHEAISALGVTLPALYSDDLAYGMETCWRHVRRLDDAARYRCFAAFWTACAVAALQGEAMVIDANGLAARPGHQQEVETELASIVGQPVDLAPRPNQPAPPPLDPKFLPPNIAEVHFEASACVRRLRARLDPARLDIILGKLGEDREASAQDQPARLAFGWRPPAQSPTPPRRMGLGRRIAVACEVMVARAMQPVRRLHGASVRLGQLFFKSQDPSRQKDASVKQGKIIPTANR